MAIPKGDAQSDIAALDPSEAQAELQRATRESERADARARRFAAQAEEATEAADKTARQAAAIAAEIQRAEADITAARARLSLAQTERAALSARLAERQQPLVRLTSALQTTARRPLGLSALQPGSLKELVYVRAVLDSAVPEIRKRTATLRSDLEQGRAIEARAQRALAALNTGEEELKAKREELARLENQQRLASREARNSAAREGERALALAEDARDLDGLIEQLDENASLRRELADLPGPVRRPSGLASPEASIIRETSEAPTTAPVRAASSSAPADFQLPVRGRTIAGFGEMRDSGSRSTGLSLAPADGAQIVAPATGRVAFSGPYRGFGRIIIIEHDGGWTSLVTGLAFADAKVGDEVIGGGPI
ncbi:MAG: peptidoglycan DD-metalloendopeptidase family protein, partial [Pseudomonadota bacterium]